MPSVRMLQCCLRVLGGCLVFATVSALAAPPRTLRFEQLGVEQGLAQESATAILQDRQGFMWIGSQAGLSRYDGYRFVLFRNKPDESDSLSDNWVTALHEDGDGRLWIGTRGGVLRFNPAHKSFQRFVPKEPADRGIGNLQIRAIIDDAAAGRDGSHAFWIATADGLERLDTRSGTFTILHHEADHADSLASDDVQAIASDRQGRLWVGTDAGLDRLRADGQGFDHFRVDAGSGPEPKGIAVIVLHASARDVLWVGTQTGLQSWSIGFEPPVRRLFDASNGLPAEPVQAILEDHDGVIWVGTKSAGLLRWDPQNNLFVSYHHEYRDPHSLADEQIDSLYQDHGGTLWVGTHDDGISLVDLDSSGFERFVGMGGAQGTRNHDKAYAVAVDGTNHVWIGTVGGGLLRMDSSGDQFTTFRHDAADPESLPNDFVRALNIDTDDQLWVGTDSGLAHYDPKTRRFRARRLADHDPLLDSIRTITRSRAGILWIGTEGGMHRYDPATDTARTFRHNSADASSLIEGRVWAIREDHSGTIWVGTEGGLDRWNATSGSFTHFRHDSARPDSLVHNRVHDLFEDRAGHVWVGTAGGLDRLDVGTDGVPHFHAYTHKDGLAADPIGGILEDAVGRLWISTTSGISRFDPANRQFRNFNASDGLQDGSYFIGSRYAAADGTLYFGGLSGLTAFRPEAIRENPVRPPVAITELQIFNRPVSVEKKPKGVQFDGTIDSSRSLWLSPANSVFSLEFAALHYADPSRNRYAYQLVGFDPGWIQTDASRRFATYTNLDPGHYVFRVKASNKDGVWNENGATLDITIEPLFWATWWFRTLAALALLGSVYALIRYRERGLTRQRIVLEGEVKARTVEVVKQKEDIEQAHGTLSVLGEIGREITAKLDQSAILQTLDRHVHGLLDATTFAVYLLDPDGGGLTSALRMEGGAALPLMKVELHNSTSHSARCARERRELHVELKPAEVDPNTSHYPGTLHTLSMLYTPLTIGDRLLGVMTIQSPLQHAYGERERLVFRTLCAYGAIALDNAIAYRRLAEADAEVQRMLREQQVIFDNVAAAVFFVKARSIHRSNRSMEEMLGYEPGELVGKPTELLHPNRESWEMLGNQVYPLITTGQVAEGEWELVRKDGRHIQVSFRGRAINRQDEEQGSIWVAQDITERNRTEAALQRALREQQTLFDNVLGGIVLTKGNTVVRCNRGMEEILGYEPGELDGRAVRSFYKTDEAYEAELEKSLPALAAGSIAQGEVEYVRKDGALLWLVYSGKAIDPQDLSQGIVWVGLDIREQKQTETALKMALQEQQAIFDNITSAIIIANQGVVQRCNRGFEEMLGLRPGDGAGKPLGFGLLSQDAWKSFVKQTAPQVQAGKVASGETEYVRSDGERRWMLYQGKAINPNDFSQGTIWFGQDITERKHDENALLEAKERLERGLADLEQINRQVSLLGELTGFLQACPSTGEAFACISDFGPRLFPDSAGSLFLAEENGDCWVEHGRWDMADSAQTMPAQSFIGSECWALRRSRTYRVDAPSSALCCPHVMVRDGQCGPYACLPLTAQGKTFGLLFIEHDRIQGGVEADRRHGLAVAMAEQIALAIANVQLREALLQQSIRDPLTGLYNRRFLQESLFREIAHSKRQKTTLAVMMIDVDHFKVFNDTFGHHAGDAVLQSVARTIEAHFRRSDVACRFGGEEFTVLLPGTSIELAQRLANGVLEGIRDLVLSHENRPLDRVTASLGIALFPDHGSTPQSLIDAADAALYQAKEAGRNRVVVCGSSMP
jgi:diguanylate cyclase (GGDEF)-like protein/PAS domain S-box-containing protein